MKKNILYLTLIYTCFSLGNVYANIKCAHIPASDGIYMDDTCIAAIDLEVNSAVTQALKTAATDELLNVAKSAGEKKITNEVAARVASDLTTDIKSVIAAKGAALVLATNTSQRTVVIEASKACFSQDQAYSIKKMKAGKQTGHSILLNDANPVVLIKLAPSSINYPQEQDILVIDRTNSLGVPETFSAFWDEQQHKLIPQIPESSDDLFVVRPYLNTSIVSLSCAS